jgi:hypothetical protein
MAAYLIYQMISDERLEKFDSLVREYLNEETAPSKVHPLNPSTLTGLTCEQGGIGAVNARVFAVKVK